MSHQDGVNKAVVLALGANLSSRWGAPPATFARALATLARAGVRVQRTSSLYRTKAVGPGLQDSYYNAVVVVTCPLPPSVLLRLIKQIERTAGRRRGRLWGPRPLDIDVIDYKGFRLGKAGRVRVPGELILPHPELHRRMFVLAPLAEAMPTWRQPGTGLSVADLIRRLPPPARGGVGCRLAFPAPLCENPGSEERSFGA